MTGASRHTIGLVLLGIALALPAAQKDRKQTEQDLKAMTERIERAQKQVAQDAVDRDRLNRDLRAAERSEASARGSLRDLRDQRTARAAARQALLDQRAAKKADLERDRLELTKQLRAAYFMGRNEPLKLLLNQRDTAEVSRILTYYGYFGRMRANQIAKLNADVANIDELTAKIDAEDAELARLEQQQKARVGDLEGARRQRGVVLASQEKESGTRSAQLARMQQQRQQLEGLLKQLSRATESTPFDPNAPFAKVRGSLTWPVAGRISVDFGETITGGLRSDGIEIETTRGTEVRAVHEGIVEYADWVPGRGLLIILNHGNGYWSVYGHNEQLFRQKGEHVQAGDIIATVGDSGGRKTPGLYFEIRSDVKPRSAGKPVDPHGWFRLKEPPAR